MANPHSHNTLRPVSTERQEVTMDQLKAGATPCAPLCDWRETARVYAEILRSSPTVRPIPYRSPETRQPQRENRWGKNNRPVRSRPEFGASYTYRDEHGAWNHVSRHPMGMLATALRRAEKGEAELGLPHEVTHYPPGRRPHLVTPKCITGECAR